jgi:hypothetical protein
MKIATFATISRPCSNLASVSDQNTTIIPQDERLRVNSHLTGRKTRAMHNSLSRKITGPKTTQHLTSARLQQLIISQDNRHINTSQDGRLEQGLNRIRYLAR